jgi:hypothetical protein
MENTQENQVTAPIQNNGEEQVQAVNESVATNTGRVETEPQAIDNETAKKIRQAAENKVAKKYDTKIDELTQKFESLFEKQNQVIASLVEQNEAAAQKEAKQNEYQTLSNMGVPEENLEFAHQFVQSNADKDVEFLQNKLNDFFIPKQEPIGNNTTTFANLGSQQKQPEVEGKYDHYFKNTKTY